jgi:hypothetical protein
MTEQSSEAIKLSSANPSLETDQIQSQKRMLPALFPKARLKNGFCHVEVLPN